MSDDFPVELKGPSLEKAKRFNIQPKDIEESFAKGSGKGGQKLNKSSNCVRLTHLPTGCSVECQKHRDREANRKTAYRLLIEKIEEDLDWENSDRAKKVEKIKKQKKRRKRRAQSDSGNSG